MQFLINNVIVGSAAFAGISIFSRIPYLGWFGWVIALGCWVWLASRVVTMGEDLLSESPDPRMPAMGYSAIVGFASGLVGALVTWIINMGIIAGASSELAILGASFGAIGATISMFTRIPHRKPPASAVG